MLRATTRATSLRAIEPAAVQRFSYSSHQPTRALARTCPTHLDEPLQRAAEAIGEADTLFITAGAGLGVDSGLPDFRGNEGFWKAYPPLQKLGVEFMDMANPDWFVHSPRLAWGFYGHRLNLYRNTTPHAGFQILHQWIKSKPMRCQVFTSNVDGQFQKVGGMLWPIVILFHGLL